MRRMTAYLLVSFAAVTAFAEEIDAEIIKNLDFYEKMPVVEELDLIELSDQNQAPEKTAGNDEDSLDDKVQDTAPGSSKGEGQ